MKDKRGRSKTKKTCLSSHRESSPPAARVRTVPTTPLDRTHLLPKRSRGRSRLSKIKSLSRIEIRSQLPRLSVLLTPLEGPSRKNDEQTSLRSASSRYSFALRLLSIVPNVFHATRNYYNDFTTIDWATAFLLANRFNFELSHRRWIVNDSGKPGDDETAESPESKIPYYYKAYLILGKWVLIVAIGFLFSLIAFTIDKIEILLVGFKHGYCRSNWFASQVSCCSDVAKRNVFNSGLVFSTASNCPEWITWAHVFHDLPFPSVRIDFVIYVLLTLMLAFLACSVTLTTNIANRRVFVKLESVDDSLVHSSSSSLEVDSDTAGVEYHEKYPFGRLNMYTACGSGVPEVKTILSGFVIRRFLGTYTLVAKTIALIFAIASGMALGKEGPYVHLATCVGNIMTRFVPYVKNNDFMKKQILSASASSGVALAFGSPLGGVLFILEEINHYLPSHQLFQVFFCAITSTLFLKFLNPYGTGKTVLFELKYTSDWETVELLFFIFLGAAGGAFGACFVKFTGWWGRTFRKLKPINGHPMFEVFLVSLITGIVSFWNPYTIQASSELVLDLATPCSTELDLSLCPTIHGEFVREIKSLIFAFIVKLVLTFITFGLKVPCGIYVPSMVVGALFGRIVGMFIQWCNYSFNLAAPADGMATSTSIMRYICSPDASNNDCVDLGIYSMISAGAFMAGVTRMNIALVTILFELTSSYTYVLPISIAIAVANWVGSVLEKNSLYESLLIQNDYPFMSSETEPIDPFVKTRDIIDDSEVYDWTEHANYDAHKSRRGTNPSSLQNSPLVLAGGMKVNQLARVSNHVYDNDKLYIDISDSVHVPMSYLKLKLHMLADKYLLDGCIPLIRHHVCVGLIYFSELEYSLDKLAEFCLQNEVVEDLVCKMAEDDADADDSRDLNYNIVRQRLEFSKRQAGVQLDYFNYGSHEEYDEMNEELRNLMNTLESLSDLTCFVDYSPIFLSYDSELALAHLIFDRIGNRVIVLLKDGKYYGVLHKKVLIDYCRQAEA